MSYTYTYLIPLSTEPEPSEYRRRVKEFLVNHGVITEETDQFGMFGAGDHSMVPFEVLEDWDPGFNFGNIFSGPHLAIVPDDDQPLKPKCLHCQADMGRELNELMCPDEETSADEIDFTGLMVTCPKCTRVFRPDQLVDEYEHGIFLTRRYLCFVDAGKFRIQWLAELDKAAGTPHRLVTYWFT